MWAGVGVFVWECVGDVDGSVGVIVWACVGVITWVKVEVCGCGGLD